MDFNHIYNNHHTPTKFPINNNNSSTINWMKQGLFNNITMDMEDHHHHHHHHKQHHHHEQQHHHQQQQQQDYNQQVQQHQPLMPLLDPIWQAYHNLPTPHQSQPPISSSSSSYIMKPNLLQHQVLEQEDDHDELEEEEEEEELGAMKEMMYRIAVMQPVDIDPATIRKPKRRNVRISNDPQSVAARHRRERISERIRILQRLVPGGTKMDTASMLDEAIRYVKFLKRQIRQLQSGSTSSNHHHHPPPPPLPVLPASDWPPLPPSAAKGVLIRDNNDDHHSGRMSFQHGGN